MTNSLGLYIHIPFCERKCNYCDFLSAPPRDSACIQQYVQALCRDIRETAAGYADGTRPLLETVYMGGGTPSVLTSEEILQIVATVREAFVLSDTVEFTMECNPHSITTSKLEVCRRAGINRLSIGMQAIQEDLLKTLGRLHTPEQFEICYRAARQVGFQNISIDVMYGLPGQTLSQWKETLAYVKAWNPEHISAYSLIVEEGTPFWEWYREGAPRFSELPDEDLLAEMDDVLLSRMEAWGYERYEISNFSKKGYASRHNMRYWRLVDYLGVGLGASSLVNFPKRCRLRKETDLSKYMQQPTYEEILPVGREEAMEEFCFLGLRMLQEGIHKESFHDLFGASLEAVYGVELLDTLVAEGLIKNTPDSVMLTRRGAEVANYVMSRFLLT